MNQNRNILLVLITLSILVYVNTFNHNYVLDDFSVIKENTIVKKGLEGIPTIWKTHYRFGYGYQNASLYRPLSLTLFAIQWQIAPDTPSLGHFCNILLYALLSLVIFKFLVQTLGNSNTLIAFITTVLFITHPIHTEVVANIKSVDDILAMLFALWSILLLFKTLQAPNIKYSVLSMLFFLLAFFSKESTVSFLIIIPFLLVLFKQISILKAIKKTAIYLIPFSIYMLARFSVLGTFSGGANTAKIDNLLLFAPNAIVKTATALKILGLYLYKLFIPHPLMNDYSFNQIELVSFSNQYVWFSILIHLALIAAVIVLYKKKPIIAFAIGFYLLNMVLYSNLLFTIGTSFGERLLFIPSLGFCLLLAYGIVSISKKKIHSTNAFKNAGIPLVITLCIGALYSFKTVTRNEAWKDNFSLYETDVKNCANSARCQYYYGLGLMKEKALLEKNAAVRKNYLVQSITAFNKAIEIYPGYADAWSEKGLAFFRLKNYPEAEKSYSRATQLNPQSSIAWSNFGSLYFNTQRYAEAKMAYEKALELNPNFLDAIANYAATLGTLGELNEAIRYFKKAIDINPNEANYYQMVGITYQNLGNNQQAAFYLNKAKQLKK